MMQVTGESVIFVLEASCPNGPWNEVVKIPEFMHTLCFLFNSLIPDIPHFYLHPTTLYMIQVPHHCFGFYLVFSSLWRKASFLDSVSGEGGFLPLKGPLKSYG